MLKRPNLSVSGVVVDEAGQPVADSPVGSRGIGQPQRLAKTDSAGRFALTEVCCGPVEVWAKLGRALYGTVEVQGGQKDVRLKVSSIR